MGDEQLWEGSEQCGVMARTALEKDLSVHRCGGRDRIRPEAGGQIISVSWGSGFALESVFKRGLDLRHLEAL